MVAAESPHDMGPGWATGRTSMNKTDVSKSKSKAAATRTEHSLLLVKADEEIHPLPWFLSPEWTKRSVPPANSSGPSSALQDAGTRHCACLFALLFCSSSSTYPDANSESDLELGYLGRRAVNSREIVDEADGSKKCIRFLVGLIVTMALALVLLIILQPGAGRAS
uniref:Uncharacterized protein n=1 Tax=Peronospora matthiolae TaxID=2874970 RepID=A0AAV1TF41_9STRA